MSNWSYVGLAFGVTYFVLVAYTVYLFRRRRYAEEEFQAEQHRLTEE